MSSLFIPILLIALLVYMIARQFMEQAVRFPALFIFPALVIYLTYTNIEAELMKSTVNLPLLIMALAVGVLPGLLLGFYRGNLMRMRLDTATGMIYAKASAVGIVIWCILLVVRIGAGVFPYLHLDQPLPALLLISALHGLFLGSVIALPFCLYMRSRHYQMPPQQVGL